MVFDLAFESVGSGPPLVLLHGLFGSGSNWRSVAASLADTYTVYSVDLRNHGASPWSDRMGYLEMAGDVRRLIDRHGLRRPAVVGHNMGGKTAMALALLYPEHVGSLVVVDIAPVAYDDTATFIAQALSRPEVLFESTATQFLMQNLTRRHERFDWRINLDVIASAASALSDFPTLLQDLRFRRAMTVIAGAESNYVRHRTALAFEPMFSDVEIEVINGAGHWVHVDQTEEFVARLRLALQPASGKSSAPKIHSTV